jgi:hypothetical protein
LHALNLGRITLATHPGTEPAARAITVGMQELKFDKDVWEKHGVIVDAGGGARFLGCLVMDATNQDSETLLEQLMAQPAGLLPLFPAVTLSYFEMPGMDGAGQLRGVNRSADLAGPYLSQTPTRVLVRANAAVHLHWVDDHVRGVWLGLVSNLYDHMAKARALTGGGIVLPGPGFKIPPHQGGRS